MEIITRVNGNGNQYEREIPEVILMAENEINEVALGKIFQNTGMTAKQQYPNIYKCKPTTAKQLTTLLMTYNFKIWYHDNGNTKNTIFLQFNNDKMINHKN